MMKYNCFNIEISNLFSHYLTADTNAVAHDLNDNKDKGIYNGYDDDVQPSS